MRHRHEADEAGLAFQIVGAFDGAVEAQGVGAVVAHARLKRDRAVARREQVELGRTRLRLRKDPRERRVEPEEYGGLLLIAEGNVERVVGALHTTAWE